LKNHWFYLKKRKTSPATAQQRPGNGFGVCPTHTRLG